ncbi:MAG: Crp/Fnr family transcriptional regulator [Pseudomonadota bacterium]
MNAVKDDFRVQCVECPIRHRAVCARCEVDELNRLETMKSYKSFEAGQPIMWRGDDLTAFSTVVSGIASLSKSLDDGRTQMVGLLLPSDFIGRPGRNTIDFDVTATTDVTLCRFERTAFEALISDTPHIAQRMLEMALDELDAARDWMVMLGRKTAREKIATFLEMLVRRSDLHAATGASVALPLTREEIANFLGLTLETVSRQMTSLRKEGVVAFDDRKNVSILDIPALHDATGDDNDGDVIF